MKQEQTNFSNVVCEKNFYLKTHLSIDELINKLKKVTIEKQPFVKPKGIMFLGKIQGNSFNLRTFDAPPMVVKFLIQDNKLCLSYKKNDLTKTFKYLIFSILFPIFIVIWIIGVFSDKYTLVEMILLTLNLILPFGVYYIIKYIYKKYILINTSTFLKKVEHILGGELKEFEK